jgi:hypothetical protein
MSEAPRMFQEAVTVVCDRLRRDARTPDQIELLNGGRPRVQELLLDARRAGIISIAIDIARSAKSQRDIATITAEARAVQALTDPAAKAAAAEQLLMRHGWIKKLDEYLDGILPPASEHAPASGPIPLHKFRTGTDDDIREALREFQQLCGGTLPGKDKLDSADSKLRPLLAKRRVRLDRKQIRRIADEPEFTRRPVGRPPSSK